MQDFHLEGAGHQYDPLDDMHASPEQEFYLTVLAACSMIIRSKKQPEAVFSFYELTVDDINRFTERYPQATARLLEYLQIKAAFIVAFFIAFLYILKDS